MERVLFAEAFAKAKKFSGKTSKTPITEYLSSELRQYKIIGISDKHLRRFYDKYLLNASESVEPSKELLDAVSKYLEYDNYEDFVRKNEDASGNADNSNRRAQVINNQIINQAGENNVIINEHNGPLNIGASTKK